MLITDTFNECQNQMWDMSKHIEEEIYNHINGFEDVIADLEEEKEQAEKAMDYCEDMTMHTSDNELSSEEFFIAAFEYYENRIEEIDKQISEIEDSSIYDYLNDVLDIEYIVSGSLDYLGCEICLAYGGPGIYLNTREQVIKGRWWGDKTDYMLNNDLCNAVDEVMEEYYNAQRY